MIEESIPEIARDVRAGIVYAVDLTREALDRAERMQPVFNAFISLDADGALDAAGRIDEAVARGENPGPLAGVPLAVKDLIDHAGRPNTRGGAAPYAVPGTTAPCISRLEEAGAVVIGRTGLHEYAFGFSSENHWFGPVKNPWDPALSPGGSSGGSAAAVSAGLVAGALGTDTGGSVRVPAALCGVVGLKVTHGRVPLTGVYPLAPMLDTVGPIGRTIADCAALYRVIAGDDPDDPWSAPQPVEPVGPPADLRRLRVGVPHPWVDQAVDPEQRAGFETLLDGLAAAGCAVIHVTVEELMPPHRTAIAGLFYEVAHIHRKRFEEDASQYGPEVGKRITGALEATGDDFLQALQWRRATRSAALRAMSDLDFLVTPTVAARRKTIGVDTIQLAGEDVHYATALSAFSAPVNHIGFPAVSIPLPGDAVPPPSAQLIGAPWSESALLEIGLAMESQGLVVTRRPPEWPKPTVDPNADRAA